MPLALSAARRHLTASLEPGVGKGNPTGIKLLLVGLGNPGERARFTRHNVGRIAVSLFREFAHAPEFVLVGDALLTTASVDGVAVALAMPRRAMNDCGPTVARLARKFGVSPAHIVLLHDDTGNKPGLVTAGYGSTTATHKGVLGVASSLQSTDFIQLRIGIGAPDGWGMKFYLEPLSGEAKNQLLNAGRDAAIVCRALIQGTPVERLRGGDAANHSHPWAAQPLIEAAVPAVPPTVSFHIQKSTRRMAQKIARSLLAAVGPWRRIVQRRVRIITVIGSLGKTTTQATIYHALGPRRVGFYWPRWARYNAGKGVALHLFAIWPWRQYGVMEVGISKPGTMEKHARLIRPDLVVMTAIASEHQENFPDLRSKVAEKAKMLDHVRSGGVLIANSDDAWLENVAGGFGGRVVRFGLGSAADVRATRVALEFPAGTRFDVTVGGRSWNLLIPSFGDHAVRAALAAVAVAHADGLALEPILARLQACAPVVGRLFVTKAANGAWLIRDDYKAPVESFEFALDLLERVSARKKFVIAGDIDAAPGAQGNAYREIGSRFARVATGVVIVGRNGERYRRAAIRAGMAPEAIQEVFASHAAAAAYVTERSGPGDVILVKGRASDRTQRASLALLGHTVRCTRLPCRLEPTCDQCRYLGRDR